jgi:hypothetical protein
MITCQCEHACHTRRVTRRTPNGNPGHKYGKKFSRHFITKVSTPYGTLDACLDCQKDCLQEYNGMTKLRSPHKFNATQEAFLQDAFMQRPESIPKESRQRAWETFYAGAVAATNMTSNFTTKEPPYPKFCFTAVECARAGRCLRDPVCSE